MKRAFASRDMLNIVVILGLAMAVLMPFCINKINGKLLQDRIKKTYGTVSAAISSALYQNDGDHSCYYNNDNLPKNLKCAEFDSDKNCIYWLGDGNVRIESKELVNKKECAQFTQAFSEVVRIAKKCENNAYKKGCIPSYKGIDEVYNKYNLRKIFYEKPQNKLANSCEKWKNSSLVKSSAAWVLGDGSIILFYGDKPDLSLFAVDVNGMSGPNRWGYDLFTLHLEPADDGLKLGSGVCEVVESGGKTFNEAF